MSQPLNRNAKIEARGEVDREAGEVWVDNPFMMPSEGVNLSSYERNRLFLNLSGEDFADASFTSGADIDADSRGVVAADFDRDGRPDLLVLSVGGGPLRLFLNRYGSEKRFTRLDLVGPPGNRAAIGARVTAHVGDRRVVRDLFAHNGGFSQGPAELLMAVGEAETIDRLEVRWPNGEVQRWEKVKVGGRQRFEYAPPAE